MEQAKQCVQPTVPRFTSRVESWVQHNGERNTVSQTMSLNPVVQIDQPFWNKSTRTYEYSTSHYTLTLELTTVSYWMDYNSNLALNRGGQNPSVA